VPSGSINDRRLGGAVEGEGIGIHVDDRPALRDRDNRIVFGEEQVIHAETGREPLLIIRCVDDVRPAEDFKVRIAVVADAGRGIGGRPTAATLIALLQEGIAERVGPVSDGVDHDAAVRFAVIIDVVEGGGRLDRHVDCVSKRRFAELRGDGAHDL
jgi:hypothetical protein